jgi:hypothetical protein
LVRTVVRDPFAISCECEGTARGLANYRATSMKAALVDLASATIYPRPTLRGSRAWVVCLGGLDNPLLLHCELHGHPQQTADLNGWEVAPLRRVI